MNTIPGSFWKDTVLFGASLALEFGRTKLVLIHTNDHIFCHKFMVPPTEFTTSEAIKLETKFKPSAPTTTLTKTTAATITAAQQTMH